MTLDYQEHWVDTEYDADARYRDFTLSVEPDEKVGPPLPSRFKSALRRLVVLAVLIGGGWIAVANLGVQGVIETARSLLDVAVSTAQNIAERVHQAAPASPAAAPAPEIAQASVAAPLPELPAAQEEKTAAADEAAPTESLGAAYVEKAEPAEDVADKSPKRKSAIAAGLGPDLPNVLLTRLSQADLRNGAYAVKTALAKTPDDGSFSWPPKPSRQQALFEVRFVQGAGEGCRRYIVTVTKDRWSSTSAALEKCGEVASRAG